MILLKNMNKIRDLVISTNKFTGWVGLGNKMVLFRFLELKVLF